MKCLGIDYGEKRIGVALSDEGGRLAFPLQVVEAGTNAVSEIDALVKENGAQKIIIGESRNFKGEPNALMEDIEQFKKDIEEVTGLAVEYEQEFLTSAMAARQGQDKRGAGGVAKSDASAAALILQSYLDRLNNHGN